MKRRGLRWGGGISIKHEKQVARGAGSKILPSSFSPQTNSDLFPFLFPEQNRFGNRINITAEFLYLCPSGQEMFFLSQRKNYSKHFISFSSLIDNFVTEGQHWPFHKGDLELRCPYTNTPIQPIPIHTYEEEGENNCFATAILASSSLTPLSKLLTRKTCKNSAKTEKRNVWPIL